MPREASFVKRLLTHLRETHGAFAFKTHGGMFSVAGIPDVIACYHGRFFAFEAKRQKGGVTTKLQRYIIEKIRDAGGVAEVVTTLEEVDLCLGREPTGSK